MAETPLPPCPHRPPCGGCPLLDLGVEAQLERKGERVRAALDRYPELRGVEVLPCVPAPRPLGGRARLKLAVEGEGEGVAIGLYAAGTHSVVDVPRCLAAHPALLPVVDELRRLLGRSAQGVRYVDVRRSAATGRVHVTLVVAGGEAPVGLARELCAARPEVAGVGLRRAGPGPTLVAVSGETRPLLGEEHLEEAIGAARFRLSPGAFFQADPAAAARLHEVVRGWLGGAGRARHLVDLYAGVGAFALALSDLAERCTAVEAVPRAADDAEASARASGVDLVVVRESAEGYAARLADERPDRVVLDPPRRGAAARVLRGLALAAPERAAYVSCDPDTLARDLAVLRPLGVEARQVTPVDLFPLSEELDAVAFLEPAKAAWSPTFVLREADLVVAAKPAMLPTHPQGEGGPSLLAAARAALGLEGLEPAHRLDVGTSGPVLLARGEALSRLGRAFEEGEVQKEYLALVRGVPRRSGRIRLREAGKAEETRYRLKEVVGGYGLVAARPATGRRHQIRRHLARIGHPILGDERYGEPRANRFLAETCGLARPFLHLSRLTFPDPRGGEPVTAEAALPPELLLVLDRLRALRERPGRP